MHKDRDKGFELEYNVGGLYFFTSMNGVFPIGLLSFRLLTIWSTPISSTRIWSTPFLHVSRDQFCVGVFSEQISMTYTLTQNMLVETNLVQTCSVNKVSKSVTVHPSLLIWQR